MEQITPEQQKQLDKLGAKFLAKSFWNGIHHGLMAVVMNILLFMGLSISGGLDGPFLMIGSVVIGIFVFRRMFSIIRQDNLALHEAAKKIIKN